MNDYYLYVLDDNPGQTERPLNITKWGIASTLMYGTKLTKEDADTLAAILNKHGCPAKIGHFTED